MPDALPYRVAGDAAVRAGAWAMETDVGKATVPEWMPAWDLASELRVSREFEVDLARLLEETGLPTGAPLAVSVTLSSSYDDALDLIPLNLETTATAFELMVSVPGHLVAKTLNLMTAVVLSEAVERTSRTTAWRRGSVLWQDAKKVRLHGDSSQFPMVVTDFAAAGIDGAVPWQLDLQGDLELPAMGAIVLLINERFESVVESVTIHSTERRDLAVLRSMLFADVGRVLAEFALSQDNIEHEFPDDSLGDVLQVVLRSRFSNSVTELRDVRLNDPQRWAAMTSAAFHELREPLR